MNTLHGCHTAKLDACGCTAEHPIIRQHMFSKLQSLCC